MLTKNDQNMTSDNENEELNTYKKIVEEQRKIISKLQNKIQENTESIGTHNIDKLVGNK
jgi:hypothetical protein